MARMCRQFLLDILKASKMFSHVSSQLSNSPHSNQLSPHTQIQQKKYKENQVELEMLHSCCGKDVAAVFYLYKWWGMLKK